MAIASLLPLGDRRKVAYLNFPPLQEEKDAFKNFEYQTEQCTGTDLTDSEFLAGVIAVVFKQSEVKPMTVVHELRATARTLLDHDCRIFVQLAPNGGKLVKNLLVEEKLPVESSPRGEEAHYSVVPRIDVFDIATSWQDILRMLLTGPSGHGPNFSLVIEPEDLKLSVENELLLRRAFWDCSKVKLSKLEGGKSGMDVYIAHVDLRSGRLGPWPMPYMVKMGARKDIFKEHENYQSTVDPYIPFHLGPHLISDRCCLGAHRGVLVGDYVEESEKLLDCARNNRATTAITSLFTQTLKGWYRTAEKEEKSLVESLKFPDFHQVDSKPRLQEAANLGSKKSPDELRYLFNYWSSLTPVRMGPIHGDLHGANVLVRGSDAVVIDFLKNDHGPLVYDAACLEASLLIDGFEVVSGGSEWDVRIWLNSIDSLYQDLSIRGPQSHPHPSNEYSWFYTCVREIRLQASQMECKDGQYAGALAIALLKKASKDLSGLTSEEESRRAVAYLLAERILTYPSQSIIESQGRP